MKIFIPIIFIVICSCNVTENKKNEVPGKALQDSSKILQTPSGKTINLIDGYQVTDTVNDYILFPLQIKDAKDEEEPALSFSKQRGEGSLYWNVVFYNYKTSESKLLEPTKKILIGGYSFDYYSSYPNNAVSAGSIETHKETPYIFYTVYSDDYNRDKKLGTDDPAYFYVSNDDGSNFKQVSPQNISITQKTFPKNNSFLLLEGLKDSNNDKKFDSDDEKVYYKVNMTDTALKVEEIFNPSFKISLKKLFDKNWKK